MAQEIDKIIKSKYPPKDKNVLWDNGENLMINRNGKWESANNELPDNFKNWSGAANFLNSNDEPGGMINMPFGYRNLNWNVREEIYYTPSTTPTLIYDRFPYVAFSVAYGYYSLDDMVFIDDILGVENAISLSAPIKIYAERALNGVVSLYAVCSIDGYYPSNICILPLTYGTELIVEKLPLSFTTPYIVGNDTQEHLDELKRLCSDSASKIVPMMILLTKHYTYILANVTLGGPPNFWGFTGLDTDGNNVAIQFPSKDISALEVGQCVEDIGATVTVTHVCYILDYERPHIKFSAVNPNYNLATLHSLGTRNKYVCDLFAEASIPNDDADWLIQNGEYFNGVITGINKGKFVQYNVDLATGVISEKANIDIVELYNKVEAITSNN